MQNYETEIIINSTAKTVWNILMDHKNYRQWNPFITEIKGLAKEGETLEVTLQPKGSKAMTMKPKVLTVNANQEFKWLGNLFIKGLFDGEHYFKIEPIGEDQVKFIHGENFSGLLVKPLLKLVGKSTLEGFIAMNKALKDKIEEFEKA